MTLAGKLQSGDLTMTDWIEPQPGELWRHFQGGLHRVVALAVEDDTGREMVVYTSIEDGRTWCRLMARWMNLVTTGDGTTVRRFVRVEGGTT